MYRNYELRKGILFVVTNWTGGMYATPGLAGSRNGGILCGTWAAMMRNGREGYKIYSNLV
jgi:sphinganine-1-phosphate aldolase